MMTYLKLKHDTFGIIGRFFWGHLDRRLGTKDPHSDPADKTHLGLCIVSNASTWSKLLSKMQ